MTYAVAALPILDAIRGLITLPSDMTADDSGAMPPKYAPNTMYIWARTQNVVEEALSTDRPELRVRVAWSRAGQGEAMGETRLRDITEELDTGIETVATAVRSHRTYEGLWRNLHVTEITHDAVVTFDVRAAWIDIECWRFVA